MSQRYTSNDWNSPRWGGIMRTYSMKDVDRLRGTVRVEDSLARAGAEKFWRLLRQEPYSAALGALTGNQAVETAQAGLNAIYLSRWQVGGEATLGGQQYAHPSLRPASSGQPAVRA